MDEGPIIGLVITIVAVLALAAGLIWLFATGTKPKWPDGEATSMAYINDLTAYVIWGRGVRPDLTLAMLAVRAADTTKKAWAEVRGTDWGLEAFGVHVLMDADFEASYPLGEVAGRKAQAYLSSASQRLGDPPPVVVMRASLVTHARATGQPIIHELLHDAGGLYHDRKHETRDVWDMPGHEDPVVERIAAKLYREREDLRSDVS